MNKKLIRNFIIMFLIFMLDSCIRYFLPYNFTKTHIEFIPSISLMVFVLLLTSFNTISERFFFGGICGLYYCIIYSNTLFISVVIYLGITFMYSYVYRNDYFNIYQFVLAVFLIIIFKELFIYLLLRITKVTSLHIIVFLKNQLLPNIILNVLLSPIIYLIFTHFYPLEDNEHMSLYY